MFVETVIECYFLELGLKQIDRGVTYSIDLDCWVSVAE